MPKIGMEPIRRKQIIESVLTTISDSGIISVTLDGVAARAGVSKGVISYYFKNKENMIIESFKSFLESYTGYLNSAAEDYYEEYSIKEILLFIGISTLGGATPEICKSIGLDNDFELNVSGLTSEQSKKILMQIYSKLAISEQYSNMIKDVYDKYLSAVTQILESGVKRGEITVTNCQAEAVRIMAILDGLLIYTITGFYGNNFEQLEIYIEYINSLVPA